MVYQGLLDLYNHGEELNNAVMSKRVWQDICYLKPNLDKKFREDWKEQERQLVVSNLQQFLNKFPNQERLDYFLRKNPVPYFTGFRDGIYDWKKISRAIYYDEF